MTRLNGDPYISHPLSVARTLVGLEVDSETVAAALLHDVVEDFGAEFGVTSDLLRNRFGLTVFQLVDGVTNVKALHGGTDRLGSVIKLFKAAIKDPRILIIKLGDRHHNMTTLEGWNGNPQKQREIAEVTRFLYTPLADQLGLWGIKRGLEDACFKYLERSEYDRIAKRTSEMRSHPSSGLLLREIKSMLQNKLDAAFGKDIVATAWRDRHLYSIYLREKKGDGSVDILKKRHRCFKR